MKDGTMNFDSFHLKKNHNRWNMLWLLHKQHALMHSSWKFTNKCVAVEIDLL